MEGEPNSVLGRLARFAQTFSPTLFVHSLSIPSDPSRQRKEVKGTDEKTLFGISMHPSHPTTLLSPTYPTSSLFPPYPSSILFSSLTYIPNVDGSLLLSTS